MRYIVFSMLLLSANVFSTDVIRLDGISIQGNSEEPNVLYITPWQPAPGAGRLFAPVNSYREQWLKPISRQVMQREVKYLNYFQRKNTFSNVDGENNNK
jgi:hypothetical protein